MTITFRIAHAFCGIGGSALGAAAARVHVAGHDVEFETVGGTDFDARACRDFERLTGAPALCADMHDLTPDQLRASWGPVAPDVVMSSPPCKGFSGLLSAKRSKEPKYQRMNGLLADTLMLLCSTWPTPPPLIFFENVPRIESRGKPLVDRARKILEAHGYAVATGNHDCGELGGLAQHRRRWFMLARHRTAIPQLIYQPPQHRVRACGEVLGPMPMPNDPTAGPMHMLPRLSWRNWVRLALIPAGGDWRDLPGVVPHGGARREVFRRGSVATWDGPAATVVGPGGSAAAAVADPRLQAGWFNGAYGVHGWDAPASTVTSETLPANGAFSVADPRFTNIMQVAPWDQPARTVIGASRVGSGALSVADPRIDCQRRAGAYGVLGWDEPAATVTGSQAVDNGRAAVADPRTSSAAWQRVAGVTPWSEPAPTVTAGAKIHAGAFQVADPRVDRAPLQWRRFTIAEASALEIDPQRPPPFIPLIVAADGTWHRPLTTLELAALQGFPTVIGDQPLVLDGTGHTRWREAVGNAVPPPSALAIAEQLLRALALAKLGMFAMDNLDVWVRQGLVA